MGIPGEAAATAAKILPVAVIVNAPVGIRQSMCVPDTGGVMLAIAAVPETTVIKLVGVMVAADAIVPGKGCRLD